MAPSTCNCARRRGDGSESHRSARSSDTEDGPAATVSARNTDSMSQPAVRPVDRKPLFSDRSASSVRRLRLGRDPIQAAATVPDRRAWHAGGSPPHDSCARSSAYFSDPSRPPQSKGGATARRRSVAFHLADSQLASVAPSPQCTFPDIHTEANAANGDLPPPEFWHPSPAFVVFRNFRIPSRPIPRGRKSARPISREAVVFRENWGSRARGLCDLLRPSAGAV